MGKNKRNHGEAPGPSLFTKKRRANYNTEKMIPEDHLKIIMDYKTSRPKDKVLYLVHPKAEEYFKSFANSADFVLWQKSDASEYTADDKGDEVGVLIYMDDNKVLFNGEEELTEDGFRESEKYLMYALCRNVPEKYDHIDNDDFNIDVPKIVFACSNFEAVKNNFEIYGKFKLTEEIVEQIQASIEEIVLE